MIFPFKHDEKGIKKLTFAGLIVTLGIVYGDIGTSPLYVLKAIVGSTNQLSKDFILGALSCIIWTLTLQTTIKYVVITLRADNKGEGGIFSLFALIRKLSPKAYIFAIIGGSTLLADGVITPAITVVSAIEGLQIINQNIPVVLISLSIIALLFFFQQFGTKTIGIAFGPVMFVWFTVLGVLGLSQISGNLYIFSAFNPVYAIKLLVLHPHGFLLLGAVFLCTTGAEALYSDLGHCGIKNIRISWIYVKITLILNYLGQGAWVINHLSKLKNDVNPFFEVMPSWFLVSGIIIATLAAVIASQALISGSYTLISEAISLNFWPKLRIKHPTTIKGQMFIPTINTMLLILCAIVVLYFQKSSHMEAAYGLAITITMLMTTFLLSIFLYNKGVKLYMLIPFITLYLSIELSFLVANLFKFVHGGWMTLLIGSLLFFIMYVCYNGRKIRNKYLRFLHLKDFIQLFTDLKEDKSLPHYATNLIYLIKADNAEECEDTVLYSIFNKRPKRADLYWLIHLDWVDEPYSMNYKITHIIPDTLIRIDLKLGFKIIPRINLYFREIVNDLVKNNEIDIISRHQSLRKHKKIGDFRFVLVDLVQNYDFDFKPFQQFIVDFYMYLKKIALPETKAFGLDASMVDVEKVPISILTDQKNRLNRVY